RGRAAGHHPHAGDPSESGVRRRRSPHVVPHGAHVHLHAAAQGGGTAAPLVSPAIGLIHGPPPSRRIRLRRSSRLDNASATGVAISSSNGAREDSSLHFLLRN